MAQYYYTVAALPELLFDAPASIQSDYFLKFSQETLSEADFESLSQATLAPQEGVTPRGAVKDFYDFEIALRNALVRYRAGNLKVDGSKYMREQSMAVDLDAAAREIFHASNPLEGAEILDKKRWEFLEDAQSGHYFDLTKLVIYYLKLQIIEERQVRTVEAGRTGFDTQYKAILAENNLENKI